MELKQILEKHSFHFKKALGQNFISDPSLLKAIVTDAGVTQEDVVLEVGAGAGTLTLQLAEAAKEVVALDVDYSLKPVLEDVLKEATNVRLEFLDILKQTDDEVLALTGGKPFKVVANLPYYITTPIIMRFLESTLPVLSLTIMVQKEVADRLTAEPGTKDYGAITLAVEMRGRAKQTRTVGRRLFTPQPNVDSAVVNIVVDREKFAGENQELLAKVIKLGFLMRRKTLLNNLATQFSATKEELAEWLVQAGIDPKARGEVLGIAEYVSLVQVIGKWQQNN